MKKFVNVILAVLLMLSISIPAVLPAFGAVEYISFKDTDVLSEFEDSLSDKGKNKISIAVNGKSDWKIVVPDKYNAETKTAIEVLKNSIKAIAGIELPVVKKANLKKKYGDKPVHCIYIGSASPVKYSISDPVDGCYRIKITPKYISINGFGKLSNANGIYGFLEDVLGVMFLTPTDTYYPKSKTVYVKKIDRIFIPSTQWRDVYAYETVQNKWAAKLRLNGINSEGEVTKKAVEELQYEGWGSWCHNCYSYLSPDEYYDSHPEYFSEKNGKRVTEYDGREAYLCLSNPEVFEIVKESLRKKIEENPDKLYWDFSGNDNYALAGCECKECSKLDKAAGGTGMGTLLPFLNKLAKEFPDKYISTLAYLHTLKAPTGIEVEPNVVIKLCAMPGDQACSYLNGDNANSEEFKEQVESWSAICDKIVIWDYVVNFAHLLMPFPNFAVQAQNQKFYEDNGVIGIFHQASREIGGEFACLRAYVLSHLMWEGSGFDVSDCVSRYVSAYYGEASKDVLDIMNKFASGLAMSGTSLGLYDGLMPHYDGYLSQERVMDAVSNIHSAERKVKGNDKYEDRLDEVKLSVYYAMTLLPEITDEQRQAALDIVTEICNERKITMVSEWASLKDYIFQDMENTVEAEKNELSGSHAGIAIAAVVIVSVIIVVLMFIIVLIKKKKR